MCGSGIYTFQTWRNVFRHNPTISSQPSESRIYTVQTQSNLFRHNPTISSQPKCVNWSFIQFRLWGVCPVTIPDILVYQNLWIRHLNSLNLNECVWRQSPAKICICMDLIWRNVSRQNTTIFGRVMYNLGIYTILTLVFRHICLSWNCANTSCTHFG